MWDFEEKNNKFKNIFLNIIIQITFSKNFFSKYNFNWILELLFEKIILIFELKLSLQKIDVLKSIVILKIVLTLSPFKKWYFSQTGAYNILYLFY